MDANALPKSSGGGFSPFSSTSGSGGFKFGSSTGGIGFLFETLPKNNTDHVSGTVTGNILTEYRIFYRTRVMYE